MAANPGYRDGNSADRGMLSTSNGDEQIVGVGAVLESSAAGPLQVTKLVPGGPAQVFDLPPTMGF